MSCKIDLQIATKVNYIPSRSQFQKWATAAIGQRVLVSCLCIRIVDEIESAQLNKFHRKKDNPTNVLSFPNMVATAELSHEQSLGDLAICASVIEREALEQHKKLEAHWAHMVIHGVLHLLGYDHIKDEEAEIMENLEIKLLAEFGFENPYQEDCNL